MADLQFSVVRVEVERFSASPLLRFELRIANAGPEERVENLLLNCQIRIEPAQRRYDAGERERLSELFGEPERWGETLRSLLWTHAHVSAPGFERETRVLLLVPCSYDFTIASTKYFYGLTDGEIPLNFLFSGSVFSRDASSALQITQIPWSKEASFRLPVAVWRSLMATYYPNGEWLRIGWDAFDRLYRFKRRKGLLTFDDALDALLEHAEDHAS
jgi:hypothetical protein